MQNAGNAKRNAAEQSSTLFVLVNMWLVCWWTSNACILFSSLTDRRNKWPTLFRYHKCFFVFALLFFSILQLCKSCLQLHWFFEILNLHENNNDPHFFQCMYIYNTTINKEELHYLVVAIACKTTRSTKEVNSSTKNFSVFVQNILTGWLWM